MLTFLKTTIIIYMLAFREQVRQRNYYEHIIRNENLLNRICNYILTNPRRWVTDTENRAGARL
jgi:hypothetical protein